jgi:hypothetical protein
VHVCRTHVFLEINIPLKRQRLAAETNTKSAKYQFTAELTKELRNQTKKT